MGFALLVLILPLVLTSCTESTHLAGSAIDTEADMAAVQQTVDDWLNIGVASLDTTLIGSYLTSSFGSMEPGWRDRTGFMDWVHSFEEEFGGPDNIAYTFSDWHTRVEGDVAWTSVVNEATLTVPGEEPVHWKWTETGVLLRQSDGRWLIDRYHSTALHDAE